MSRFSVPKVSPIAMRVPCGANANILQARIPGAVLLLPSLTLYLKQPLPPPQHKISCCLPHLNHRRAIGTTRWFTIPLPRNNKFYNFCYYNVVEIEAHFGLVYTLYNSISDTFPSLIQNVVLGSLPTRQSSWY